MRWITGGGRRRRRRRRWDSTKQNDYRKTRMPQSPAISPFIQIFADIFSDLILDRQIYFQFQEGKVLHEINWRMTDRLQFPTISLLTLLKKTTQSLAMNSPIQYRFLIFIFQEGKALLADKKPSSSPPPPPSSPSKKASLVVGEEAAEATKVWCVCVSPPFLANQTPRPLPLLSCHSHKKYEVVPSSFIKRTR